MAFTVFYLDDEEALCEIFSDFFSSDEVQIETFSDINSLLKATLLCPPDLYFIDYRLPEQNGDEVAKALPPSIPKVLVTGEIRANYTYDFIAVLSKPYDYKLVQKIIDRYKTL
jgi:DNA-binding NtrC family response regulator